MNTVKVKKGATLMIAHRGLSGLEPENSIPAFIAAGNRSYYGIETDVHVTRDGKFVVIHDDRTGRVAEDDVPVEQSTYSLLRKINLHNICGKEKAAGITPEDVMVRPDLMIPSLKEYVIICKKYCKKCVLELKNRFEPDDIRRLIAEIEALDYLNDMIFISFSLDNMICLRELLPNHKLQYLTGKYDAEILKNLDDYHLDLDVKYTALTKEAVEELHAHGHQVNCWTCDDKEAAEELISWGVDFITSNILE